jgi:hypothetical protein
MKREVVLELEERKAQEENEFIRSTFGDYE